MKSSHLLFLILAICSGSSNVVAGGGHHHGQPAVVQQTTIENTFVYPTTTEVMIQRVVQRSRGSALGFAASQTSLDSGTTKFQLSGGLGFVDDSGAIAARLGKKINGIMYSGSIGVENLGKDSELFGIGAGVLVKW